MYIPVYGQTTETSVIVKHVLVRLVCMYHPCLCVGLCAVTETMSTSAEYSAGFLFATTTHVIPSEPGIKAPLKFDGTNYLFICEYDFDKMECCKQLYHLKSSCANR